MGRFNSYLDAIMVLLLLLLTLTVDKTTVAGKIIFPDTESCTLHTGEQGHCQLLPDCPPVLQTFKEQPSVSCGFENFTQIVCCPDTTTKDKLVDISPPSGYDTLDCGKDAILRVFSGGQFGGAFLTRRKRANVREPDFIEPPIVQGVVARTAWPWMALLGMRDAVGINWFCGGALINEQWILTALHCFHDFRAHVVRLGEYNYEDDFDGSEHEDIEVAETILYPDYKYPEAYHDLALLKLNRKVVLQEFILPVCLPWGSKIQENIVNTTATIVGWGHTLFGGFPSSVLMQAEVKVFPSSRCNSSYSSLKHYPTTWPNGIGENILCASDPEDGKDSCQGDSGGPMVTQDSQGRYVAAGVVSQGFGCGHKDYPGLYANLRYAPYLAWIKKVAFGPQ